MLVRTNSRSEATRLAGISAAAMSCYMLFASVQALAQAQSQDLDVLVPEAVIQSLEAIRPAQAVPGEIIVKFRAGPSVAPRLQEETAAPLGLSTAAVPTSGGELIYRLNI